ncbi:MAG: ribosomal-protein-S5-alanine N-acetyltransferase [Pelotomaculum sp. PtaU1.Bin035]|nr:MAG: ribosomal-protein-S5-alanine N-acetyltransferase [Pelotomaculum sp. PtaU1.Bin035]
MNYKDFGLRSIEEKDLEIILGWRNSDRIRANMFTDHIITMEEHRSWFERLQKRQKDIYLVFEYNDYPVGIVNFIEMDSQIYTYKWGFYIGEEDVPKGLGSIMGFMGLKYIFKKCNKCKVKGEAFVFNEASINFHKKLGFNEEGYFPKYVLKNGEYKDVILFSLSREDWIKNKPFIRDRVFQNKEIFKDA